MLFLGADDIRAAVAIPRLVDAIEQAFRDGWTAPERQVVEVPGGAGERLLLLMPAFAPGSGGAVKLVTLFPDNAPAGLPTIQGAIVVFSETGEPTAVLDGTVVTRLRTGAASALASRYLSRPASSHLVLIGTGALAPYMAAAHRAVRPLTRISVLGRHRGRAEATAGTVRELVGEDVEVTVAERPAAAVPAADIVCCATSSKTPVLRGEWLREGVFVDLVGAFKPTMREADDAAVLRARIFVDTFTGALAEAGDILDPLRRGIIRRERIEGELADLVCGRVPGRRDEGEITLFKSVGTAIEDLAAARLLVAGAGEAR